jgi:hypothetical protein
VVGPWREAGSSRTLRQPRLATRIRPPCGDGYDGARRSSRQGREPGQPEEVVINKRHDFAKLEREYITSRISLRELCRRNAISAHSLITVQAKKGRWGEKREAYQARESESFIEHHADRAAAREAEIRDKALDAIDEAITRFRQDLRATKRVRQPDGTISEEPVWLMTPKDLAMLIDRFQVLYERPSVINQHQGLSVTSPLSADALRDFIEATRRRGEPSQMEGSPLPRSRRLDD